MLQQFARMQLGRVVACQQWTSLLPPSVSTSRSFSASAAFFHKEIRFPVVYSDSAPGETGSAEDPSEGIPLARPDDALEGLQNADDVVIPNASIKLEVDYPLSRPFIFRLQAPAGAQGFTRRVLAQSVSDLYHRIYEEEERTSSTAAGLAWPLSFNRNTTHGRYGIRHHFLEDLVLINVEYNQQEGVWVLGIDS